MKYTVIDVKEGLHIPMADQAAVVEWWKDRFGGIWPQDDSIYSSHNFFRELNLTGKDIRRDSCGSYDLRQFQVLDELGCPVDLRAWPKEIWTSSPKVSSQHSSGCGSKKVLHRMDGPKARRQMLRLLSSDVDFEEVEQVVVLDKTRVTRKSTDSTCGDSGIRRYFRENNMAPSRSWKDQTKAARQYAKRLCAPEITHSKRVSENFEFILTRLVEDGIGTCPAHQSSFKKAV